MDLRDPRKDPFSGLTVGPPGRRDGKARLAAAFTRRPAVRPAGGGRLASPSEAGEF